MHDDWLADIWPATFRQTTFLSRLFARFCNGDNWPIICFKLLFLIVCLLLTKLVCTKGLHKLESYSVPITRNSQDLGKVNSHGIKLLDICKTHNLCIANGRQTSGKSYL